MEATVDTETPDLRTPLLIGSVRLRNRLYRAPVLEGAGGQRDPGAIYARHFVPNARSGVGLIVQGHTVVTPHGNTSPGMCTVRDADDILQLAPMVAAVHDAGAAIVLQIGHGGAFSLASWHAEARRTQPPCYAPSPLPPALRLAHRNVHVLSDPEVRQLVERFGEVAAWARDAGYDGVQLAASNAKLLHLFLSRTWNRRDDAWGGRDPERRFALLAAIRDAIARHAGPGFPVLLKMAVQQDGVPWLRPEPGITPEDGVAFARLAEQCGFAAITPVATSALPDTSLCRGGDAGLALRQPNLARRFHEASGSRLRRWVLRSSMARAARLHPWLPVWNRAIVRTIRAAVSIPVFAVGGIRTRAEADDLLSSGDADLIGIGRPFYAEPRLAARLLADGPEANAEPVCESCNRCVVPQMLGMPAACYRRVGR